MAGDDVVSSYARSYLSRQRDSESVRKCCCTSLQYRASCLIFFSVGLIFVSEYWQVAGYLVFIGSTGIFAGVFLIILDFTLYLQTKTERRGRRFGRNEMDNSSIWTTSVDDRGRALSFDAAPPDYQTTMNQLDVFPLYLQDGPPMTSSHITVAMDEGGVDNEVEIEDEDDKLPSYSAVMEGSVPVPINGL